jgi:beta-phosphoglucomutase
MSIAEDAATGPGVAPAFPLAAGLGLIFDLDGVIVDSMPVHSIAWERYTEAAHWRRNHREFRMHGLRNDEIVREFLGPSADYRIVLEHGAAKEHLYRQMMRDQLEQRLVHGVRDFLRRIPAPAAIATNAEPANVDFVLDGANLRSYFRVTVDGMQVQRAKPAPDIYLRAAEQLGLAPHNCIVFEDSPVGVASAAAAGARVVGILTHENALQLTAGGAKIAVSDFLDPELEPWLAIQRAT